MTAPCRGRDLDQPLGGQHLPSTSRTGVRGDFQFGADFELGDNLPSSSTSISRIRAQYLFVQRNALYRPHRPSGQGRRLH